MISSDPAVANASVDGNTLRLTAVGEGDATVTVTATDNLDRVATLQFDVTIGLTLGGLRGWRLGVLAEQAQAAEEGDESNPNGG